MSVKKRIRKIGSIKNELVKKSREAALASVQILNNPNITFKSETFIVLMMISWTYLLHAYFREKRIEYRYFSEKGIRKKYDLTARGAYKYWELERCINCDRSPLDNDTANNLRFLIGLRHEIEHQMTTRIDDYLSARFQACCLNYNSYIKQLFGEDQAIDRHLIFSLQFSTITTEQKDMLADHVELPRNILAYISSFDESLSPDEYGSQRYAYRILFVQKTANTKGQADRVIEFVKQESSLAATVNREYTLIKETEKAKIIPSQIVRKMKDEGYIYFTMHEHIKLWKKHNAQDPSNGFGVLVAGKSWYWYERWVTEVRKHCENEPGRYGRK